MISHRKKFIFIHIPKTGGTSIARLLFNHCEMITKHQFAADMMDEARPGIDYFSFAVVRNPWDREVSRYFYQRRKPDHELYKEANGLSFKQWLKNRHCDKYFMSFYGAPMLDWISDDRGNVLIDYIARFEKLDEEWNIVRDKLGIGEALNRLNTSQHDHYSAYYDDETNDMIEKVYKKDIDYFKYSFDGTS